MGSKVTFDYSKADAFISAHEMESMKKITEAAKAELLEGREQEMISLAGSIFRLIMIKRSSRESRKPLQRSSQIQRCW
mgnify:CR=1 FL=1